MRSWTLVGVLVVAMAAAGCAQLKTSSPTSPSSTSSTSSSTGGTGGTATMNYLSAGTLTSVTSGGLLSLDPGKCGNFTWAITSWSLTSANGTFSATCGGGLSLAGTATATLASTSSVSWSATGNVTGLAQPCTFNVGGTAALEGTGVRVNYTANVCGVTISGSELLKKP